MPVKNLRARAGFAIGFLAAGLAAYAYVEHGAWTLPLPWSFPEPTVLWARALLAPGWLVARAAYFNLFRGLFSFRAALWASGVLGTLVMGCAGGLIGLLLARPGKRR